MSNTYPSRLALLILFGGSALFAESFSTTEYVTVTKSVPNYSTIQETVPSERCYDVKEQVSSGSNNDIVGAVAGGALGGVIGHQIGGGSGKTVATVGGAVLGTLAGQRVGSTYGNSAPTYQIVRKCETVNSYKTRQVMDGYTNFAKYKGREISVESNTALKQIPITITYSY
ncbi:glycine zipper 2TM domain-containing protein [Sulfuricurvum sp.]|uniref:glycine zipper 2TM domain-containing protein n=1 Tax=Sulfuricurvum sp. TaxID=2025608 RepID=UPI003BB690C1